MRKVSVVISSVVATTMLLTVAACGAHDDRPKSTARSSGSVPSGTSPQASDSTSDAPAAALPDPTISAAAQRLVGDAAVQAAWSQIGPWILAAGFQPDLIRSTSPTEADLAGVTDLMTAGCKASFLGLVSTRSAADIDSIESMTSVGVTAPTGSVVASGEPVSGRSITQATADIGGNDELVFAVTSRADIHFVMSNPDAQRAVSTLTRTTSYTVVQVDDRWLVDAWQGSYSTSDPTAE